MLVCLKQKIRKIFYWNGKKLIIVRTVKLSLHHAFKCIEKEYCLLLSYPLHFPTEFETLHEMAKRNATVFMERGNKNNIFSQWITILQPLGSFT